MQEKIDNHLLLGELSHPEDREEIDPTQAAICMAERPKKGKDGFLYGVFDILNTPNGRILKTLCDYGCNIGISSRGTGDIIYDNDGNEMVDPDTYVCETWDAVLVPGVQQARLQYVTEALDTKKRNKTLRQKLLEELDNASEEDKKIMNEALNDLDINLNESDEYVASVGDCKIYKDGDMYKTSCDGKELKSDDFDRLVNLLKGENMNTDEKSTESVPKEDEKGTKSVSNEELEDEDGWGEEIPERLESIFSEIESVMYEVRNCRRGSFGIRGDTVSALAGKLNTIADELQMEADDLESDEDRLDESKGFLRKYKGCSIHDMNDTYVVTNEHGKTIGQSKTESGCEAIIDEYIKKNELDEGMPRDYNKQRALIGRLYRINQLSDEILSYDREYDFNEEEDQLVIDHINDTLDKIRDLAARLNIPTNEGCDDKEVNENVGNTELVNQLQEALTNSAKLEKDNLSLQEKLSVCNAKEIKLEEELSKYRKATASLSESTKKIRSLKEELDSTKDDLKKKDKLLESKDNAIKSYRTRLSTITESNKDKLNESVTKVSDLEKQVKELTEQLEEKSKKLDKVTSIAKKYKGALKESNNSYIKAKAEANGLDENEIRSQLRESYTLKDVDSVCEELSEYKRNMSKLPFRIDENVKLNFKSSGDYIRKSDYVGDDEISKTLLNFID